MRTTCRPAAMMAAFFVVVPMVAPSSAAPTLSWTVDCSRGQSINRALAHLPRQKLTLTVRGTCNESVLIDRDDVALQGDPRAGATVSGPDAKVDTILISGSRITIQGLSVAGGQNGISAFGASNVSIVGNVIRNSGASGVSLTSSQAVWIDGNRIEQNGSHGISLEQGASAAVSNNVITSNTGAGMHLGGKSNVSASGNTISSNGSNGVQLFPGCYAGIWSNTITANGTKSAERGNGVFVSLTSADIGGNSITNNRQSGVLGDAAILNVGNNTITGNDGGVVANLAATLVEVGNTISNNRGFGVLLNSSSTGRIAGAKIQFNSGDGILVQWGSKLFLGEATSTVGGNGAFGLRCTDAESSVVGLELLSVAPPNGQGDVSSSCTGF